jgi:hypothetical protein
VGVTELCISALLSMEKCQEGRGEDYGSCHCSSSTLGTIFVDVDLSFTDDVVQLQHFLADLTWIYGTRHHLAMRCTPAAKLTDQFRLGSGTMPAVLG